MSLLAQPGGDGHQGVLGVAPGGEGVGGGVVDDVDLRHRHAGRDGHLLHHVEELRVVLAARAGGPATSPGPRWSPPK